MNDVLRQFFGTGGGGRERSFIDNQEVIDNQDVTEGGTEKEGDEERGRERHGESV